MPEMKQDRIALDRAQSVRTVDPTSGHLHVSTTNISAARINPYRGDEIPDADRLGLTPTRTYMLLRDPAELEKAAPTFEGKPLLDLHKPQMAKDHDHAVTVGAVSSVRWEAPFLKAALHVWDGDAIDGIESDKVRQLSCGYAYTADMTPGEFEGVRYDGVMRDIRGNHVALVEEGRAGPDVMVGDSAHKPNPIKETDNMAKQPPLSRKALLASGALRAYTTPRLAADAKLDLSPILAKVTAKTWKADKPKIKAALDAAMKGKMAKDADIDDVIELLDTLDDVTDEVADVVAEKAPDAVTAEDDDGDVADRVKAVLEAANVPADTITAVMAALKPEVNSDPVPPAVAADADKPAVTKAAMDAAIRIAADAAARNAETATIARLRGIQQAEREVQPFIGQIAIAQDSAPAVYKLALDSLNVDLTGVPTEAYGALLRALPKPGDVKPNKPRLAADAASTKAYADRFPNANRLAS